MQQAAERALENGLSAIEKSKRYKHTSRAAFLTEVGGEVKEGVRPPYLQGGLVALAAVLALVVVAESIHFWVFGDATAEHDESGDTA